MTEPRVLLMHNRYREPGGEERALEFHAGALARAGIAHARLERRSDAAGSARAAGALLRGGTGPREVAHAVRELGATHVHVHNMLPLFGPRALAAAQEAGARTVLHLHNFRLFCSIAVAFRDGRPCFRCRGRTTLPGLVLNCRGSLPESAVYTAALAAHQPGVFAHVDRFVAPSRYAVGQLVRLGVPEDRIEALPHYLPATALAERSRADAGRFALAAGRLGPEKGFAFAVEAAAASGVPLRVAGDGPLRAELEALAAARSAPVEFLGRVSEERLRGLLEEAAMVVVPSQSDETFGYAALEAMGAGLPVVATDAGALPEVIGAPERCAARYSAAGLATRMATLWALPELRRAEGEAGLARARARFGEERFVAGLRELYARVA